MMAITVLFIVIMGGIYGRLHPDRSGGYWRCSDLLADPEASWLAASHVPDGAD
ncbi:hypothetical protein [Alcaligenes phenolicus]